MGCRCSARPFPRAFCDANREAWELDPAMFQDALPAWVNTAVAAGWGRAGTIARVVASGEAIYRDKLRVRRGGAAGAAASGSRSTTRWPS